MLTAGSKDTVGIGETVGTGLTVGGKVAAEFQLFVCAIRASLSVSAASE